MREMAPTDFSKFQRFTRSQNTLSRLNQERPWAVSDAPNWAQQASLEAIDNYFHGWSLNQAAKDTVRHSQHSCLPDNDASALSRLVVINCLPDFRYGRPFDVLSASTLPLSELAIRQFATTPYDSRYALIPGGLGLASVARYMAEALLIVAHNGGLLLVDEHPQDGGGFECHVFDESNPYDWAILWESDWQVHLFFQSFLWDAIFTTRSIILKTENSTAGNGE